MTGRGRRSPPPAPRGEGQGGGTARTIEPVYIGLGANLGDRAAALRTALRALAATRGVAVLAVSPVYETAPVGPVADQPAFLNAVVTLRTVLPPRALLATLLDIERRAGRDRRAEVRGGPRPLDLDLLLYGDAVIDEPGLGVPHPRMTERAFVLRPLLDLDPEARDPRTGQPFAGPAANAVGGQPCARTAVALRARRDDG